LSQPSLDELLKLVDEAEQKQQRSVKNKDENSVNRFISDLEIKTGLERIPTFVIYYTYKKVWFNKVKDKKVNKIVFFRAFNKLFTQHRTNKQRYYLLDGDPFDLTREGLLEAENFDKRLKSGKKEKKKMGQSKKKQKPKA
jgi:hypothetical protein